MMNTAVIEHMLQLPGLDKDMIVNVSNIFRDQNVEFFSNNLMKQFFPEVLDKLEKFEVIHYRKNNFYLLKLEIFFSVE